MQNKIIITLFIGLTFISFSFLIYTETKNKDLNSRNLWFLYFANPKDLSLDFNIENHTNNTNFHYEILLDKTTIQKSDLTITKNETKTIHPSNIDTTANKKITIKVTDTANTTKEIYKTF